MQTQGDSLKKLRFVFVMLVVVIALGAVVASGEENKAEKVGSSDSDKKTSSKQEVFAINDVVKLGDWTVQVYGVQDPVPVTDEFSKPDDGNRWVGVDTEVKNLSDEEQIIVDCFELQDDANHTYSEDIFSGVKPEAPSSNIDPDGAQRGIIVFQVPSDYAGGFELRFACDFLDTGSARIKLK